MVSEATIVTGKHPWDCVEDGLCTISSASAGTINGSPQDELFLGTDGDDVLKGGEGNDCMYGFLGADEISAEWRVYCTGSIGAG